MQGTCLRVILRSLAMRFVKQINWLRAIRFNGPAFAQGSERNVYE